MPRMLDRIEQLMRGQVPPLEATERHANPMGTVHGGILADIADAAWRLRPWSSRSTS